MGQQSKAARTVKGLGNPFAKPNKHDAMKTIVEAAEQIDKQLKCGVRKFSIQVGIGEALAELLCEAGWIAVSILADDARTGNATIWVASDLDPIEWIEAVEKLIEDKQKARAANADESESKANGASGGGASAEGGKAHA